VIKAIIVNNSITLGIYAISIIIYFFIFFTLEWKWKMSDVTVEISLFVVFALLWFFCGFFLTGIILRKDSLPLINFISVSSVFILGIALLLAANLKVRIFGNYVISRGDLSVLFPYSNILNEIFDIYGGTGMYAVYMILPSILFFLGIQLKK